MTMRGLITDLIRRDVWSVADGERADGPVVIRFRSYLPSPTQAHEYEWLLVACWAYADEGTGAMPSKETMKEMEEFEERLCGALERDALAVLTAILTFDGARQWVFYTHDVDSCGERINSMPQNVEPYPIELSARPDPEWRYLHDGILNGIDAE